jgi:hypothetical protein
MKEAKKGKERRAVPERASELTSQPGSEAHLQGEMSPRRGVEHGEQGNAVKAMTDKLVSASAQVSGDCRRMGGVTPRQCLGLKHAMRGRHTVALERVSVSIKVSVLVNGLLGIGWG